MIKGQGAPAKM